MKQKDILLIAVVVIISGTIAFFISNLLFKVPQNQEAQVEVVEPITTQFSQPDSRYFNANSIDPTQNINIGDSQNLTPFNNNNSSQ